MAEWALPKCLHVWVGQQGGADRALVPCLPKVVVRRMVSLSLSYLGISPTLEEKTTQSLLSKNPERLREWGSVLRSR